MQKFKKHIPCIGFACIGLLFIVAGISKIVDFGGATAMVEAKNIAGASFWVTLALIIELAGGLMIFFKYHAHIAAGILALYLAIVTIIFHIGDGQLMFFFNNLALLGGLFLVKYLTCGTCCSSKDTKGKKSDKGCCGGSTCGCS